MYEPSKIAEIIKNLAKSKNIMLKDLFDSAGMGRNTMAHMVDGSMPKADNLAKIAEQLDCTVEYLLGKSEVEKPNNIKTDFDEQISKKDKRDIAVIMEKLIKDFDSNEALMFDGEPLDDESKELLKISLENSMNMGKAIAKNKYTPKKRHK